MQHYGLLLRMKNTENSSVLDQTAQTAQKVGGGGIVHMVLQQWILA